MGAIYLGIDMGTASARCLAVDANGTILALTQQRYPIHHPHQGWAEQDPNDYWRALIAVVSECVQSLASYGHHSRDIAAMAMSSQGETLIVADEDGAALAPAMSWMDERAEDDCRALLAEADQSFWYREMGSQLGPLSSACKLRWLARERPDVWALVQRVCAVPDYLAARLCGQFATDIPSASWSPCFTPQKRSWSSAVMRLLGVCEAQLPRLVEAGAPVAPLLLEVAEQMGLSSEVVLVAGAFDQAAAALGAGAAADGRSVLSCGTAWVLYSVVTAPPSDPRMMIPVCCHADLTGLGLVVAFTGGAAYEWFGRTFPGNRGQTSGSERDPLYFLPYLYGAEGPDDRRVASGTILGLTLAHDRNDVEKALMNGMACEARWSVELVESVSGPISALRMVGGASKSAVWPQIIADLLDRPIEVPENAESAAYGAAMLAAGAKSWSWLDKGATRLVTPEPAGVRFMEDYYSRYQHFRSGLIELYGSTAGRL